MASWDSNPGCLSLGATPSASGSVTSVNSLRSRVYSRAAKGNYKIIVALCDACFPRTLSYLCGTDRQWKTRCLRRHLSFSDVEEVDAIPCSCSSYQGNPPLPQTRLLSVLKNGFHGILPFLGSVADACHSGYLETPVWFLSLPDSRLWSPTPLAGRLHAAPFCIPVPLPFCPILSP